MKKTAKFILFCVTLCILVLLYSCSNSSTSPTTTTTSAITGKVIDAYGNAVGSVTVYISGQTTTTASDGSFTINNITPPYNAYAWSSSLGLGVYGVLGLNTTTPYLPYGQYGTFIPGFIITIPTVPAGSRATVIYQDTVTGKVSGSDTITAGANSTTINLSGITGQTTAGKIYVLEYNISGGIVTSYTGYAEQSMSFTIGSAPSPNITSWGGGLGIATVSGTANSSGGSNFRVQLYINFGSKNNIIHRGGFIESVSTNSFNFNVPTGTASSANYNVVAITVGPPYDQRMQTLAANTSGATINMDTSSTLLSPSNGASGVDTTTTFSYTTSSSPGVHFVRLTPIGGTGKFFQIMTAGTSLTVPNLAAFGYTLGTTTPYNWNVSKTMNIANTDSYCSQLFDLNPAILATTQSLTTNTFTSK